MHPIRLLALVSAVFALVSFAASPAVARTAPQKTAAAAASTTPAAFATAFYRGHFARHQRWDVTVKQDRMKFAPELRALLDEDEKRSAASPDEIVGLDFDPIINAQEEATRFAVGAPTADGDATIVPVSVYFGKDPVVVRLRLVPDGKSWLIANILYAEGDLIAILKENATATP